MSAVVRSTSHPGPRVIALIIAVFLALAIAVGAVAQASVTRL